MLVNFDSFSGKTFCGDDPCAYGSPPSEIGLGDELDRRCPETVFEVDGAADVRDAARREATVRGRGEERNASARDVLLDAVKHGPEVLRLVCVATRGEEKDRVEPIVVIAIRDLRCFAREPSLRLLVHVKLRHFLDGRTDLDG